MQGRNNFDYRKKTGNAFLNAEVFSLKLINFFLACQIRILALQNSPSESQKTTNPIEHSYQKARAHFVELLYPGQNTYGRLGLFPCVTDLMI